MVNKVVIGGLGVAVAGTAIAAASTQGFGLFKEIIWHALSLETDYDSSSGQYKDKFGGKFGKHLVGLDSKNEAWWNQKYKEIKDNKPSTGKFANVDKGYGEDSNALKKVCGDAYKADTAKITDNGNGTDEFKKEEVWKFCSVGEGKQPKTIQENNGETYTGTNFGETKKANLLSINSQDNQWVWDLRQKEFAKATLEKGHFKTFQTPEKSVKDACKGAYSKTATTTGDNTNKLTEAEVLQWCSL